MKRSLFVIVALLVVIAMLLAAQCPPPASPTAAPTKPAPGKVNVMAVWGGDEADSFKAVYGPWEKDTGNTVQYEGTRDLTAVLKTRVQGGNPPDIAILPNPGLMVEYAKDGKLVALDGILDMTQMKADYAKAWLDTGSYGGKLYGVILKAANKGTVWYNPKAFQAKGYTPPKTWAEMIALSDKIVADGGTPWSVATESGAATGWSLTDWIAQIVLTQSGPDVYDKWVKHEIPWTDPAIKKAFETFGQIATKKGYVLGGADGILATNFVNGCYPLYEEPPKAYMYYLGDFTEGFITKQFPSVKAGETYDFFPWPSITAQYDGGITGGCDVVVVFKDTPQSQSFIKYLASAKAQIIWAKLGGYTSPNKSVSLEAYPNPIAKKSAQMLTAASTFRIGAGDLMGGAVQAEFWKQSTEFVKNPTKLDDQLAAIEAKAKEQYK